MHDQELRGTFYALYERLKADVYETNDVMGRKDDCIE